MHFVYAIPLTQWNDNAILADNKGLAALLEPKPILVAHRRGGSSSTYVLTKYLDE
jgi:ABC-type phosphate transport system substrate-binding protein